MASSDVRALIPRLRLFGIRYSVIMIKSPEDYSCHDYSRYCLCTGALRCSDLRGAGLGPRA